MAINVLLLATRDRDNPIKDNKMTLKEKDLWRDGRRYKKVTLHDYQSPKFTVKLEQNVWAKDKVEWFDVKQFGSQKEAEDWFDRFVTMLAE